MPCSAEGHGPEHRNPLLNQARFPMREESAKHSLGWSDWKESVVIRTGSAEARITGWSLQLSSPTCITGRAPPTTAQIMDACGMLPLKETLDHQAEPPHFIDKKPRQIIQPLWALGHIQLYLCQGKSTAQTMRLLIQCPIFHTISQNVTAMLSHSKQQNVL